MFDEIVEEIKLKRLNGREKRAYHRYDLHKIASLSKKCNRLTEVKKSALIKKAQRGDIEARDKLLLDCLGIIFFCLKSTPYELWDDFFSELVLLGIKCIYSYRAVRGATFGHYLTTSLKFYIIRLKNNYYIRVGRYPSINKPLSRDDARSYLDFYPDLATVKHIENRLLVKDAMNALESFGMAYGKEVLWATKYLGFSAREVADGLKTTKQSVDMSNHRAHVHVRNFFEIDEENMELCIKNKIKITIQ